MAFLSLLLCFANTSFSQNQNQFEISKNLEIFNTLYKELNTYYVDDLEAGELMQTGIEAMLETVDPYTIYIPESKIEDVRMMTTGKYGGMGSLIQKQGEYVVITEPYEGSPSAKAGIKAGDRIISIDGKNMIGKSSSDVSTLLKGEAGTSITLEIEKQFSGERIEYEITRENIKIPDVPYYGIVGENTGYIKLTGFTQHASRNVRNALKDLKSNNNISSLILDLRNNGGGLLSEAVNIVNLFVDKGKLVVTTKGKMPEKDKSYNTRYTAIDKEIPLIVMVNSQSASASEIVAGAIQDFDRGIILGHRTFGKGLVQNVIPLNYNTQMKITVAKYYIPSGRCIQAIDYSHKDENGRFEKIPDSLVTEFKTQNGRKVFDGGGIMPDIKTSYKDIGEITINLFSKNIIFNFANKYYYENDTIITADKFEVSDDLYNDFIKYVKEQDFEYATQTERKLADLRRISSDESYSEELNDLLNKMEEELSVAKENDIHKHKEDIKQFLLSEIVTRYYYLEGRIESSLKFDPDLESALELFNDSEKFTSILNPEI